MKKNFSNLCFSLAGLATIAVPQTVQADESLPYWKDIQVVSVNREEPRSAFMTFSLLPLFKIASISCLRKYMFTPM